MHLTEKQVLIKFRPLSYKQRFSFA